MGIAIPEILTQAFSFILLVFLLKKFAWKPLLALLDARREKIRSDFDKIDAAKKEVVELKAEYERRQSHIEEESRSKLEAAVQEGRRIAREIEETSRSQARDALEKAKQDIQLETQKAKVTLRDEIAGLVVSTAEQLLEMKIDSKKDKELTMNLIKNLEKMT
jgi:F-type H+-transporting ATPase subunit b